MTVQATDDTNPMQLQNRKDTSVSYIPKHKIAIYSTSEKADQLMLQVKQT
jgi:hypothetical protein